MAYLLNDAEMVFTRPDQILCSRVYFMNVL